MNVLSAKTKIKKETSTEFYYKASESKIWNEIACDEYKGKAK